MNTIRFTLLMLRQEQPYPNSKDAVAFIYFCYNGVTDIIIPTQIIEQRRSLHWEKLKHNIVIAPLLYDSIQFYEMNSVLLIVQKTRYVLSFFVLFVISRLRRAIAILPCFEVYSDLALLLLRIFILYVTIHL